MSSWVCVLCVSLCVGVLTSCSAHHGGAGERKVQSKPSFIVIVPAVLHSGEKSRFCVMIEFPNEMMSMDMFLGSSETSKHLNKIQSVRPNPRQCKELANNLRLFAECFWFKVPLVKRDEVQTFQVMIKTDTFEATESRKILIKAGKVKIFIQTSLPVYQPGETVHFRVAVGNKETKPSNTVFKKIQIQDPHHVVIGQWLNQTSTGHILQFSYPLSTDAADGLYRIIVKTDEEKVDGSFRVQKIALPKFKVKVTVTKEIPITQDVFEIDVCARYPYGKPVEGKIKVKVCRPLKGKSLCSSAVVKDFALDLPVTSPCKTITKQAHRSGCTDFSFKLEDFIPADQTLLLNVLDVSVTVEEDGTYVSQTATQKINITFAIGRLNIVQPPEYFIPGSPLSLKVKALDFNNKPVPDLKFYLFLGKKGSEVLVASLQTHQFGLKVFQVTTVKYKQDLILTVSSRPTLDPPEQQTTFYSSETIRVRLLSPTHGTVNFLRVEDIKTPLKCGTVEEISILYSLQRPSCGHSFAVLYFHVLSRGNLDTEGHTVLHLKDGVTENKFSFRLKVTQNMVPHIQVLAYVVLGFDNVLAHTTQFPVDACFNHEVKVGFSPDISAAGQNVTLELSAKPKSLCGLSVFSQNVLIKEPGVLLDAAQILGSLFGRRTSPIPAQLEEHAGCVYLKEKTHYKRHKRDLQKLQFDELPLLNQEDEDAYTVTKNLGLWFITNLLIRNPTCVKVNKNKYLLESSQQPEANALEAAAHGYVSEALATCPEAESEEPLYRLPYTSWLFNLETIGVSGTNRRSLTVPEPAAPWVAEAFCFSDHGFSLAPTSQLVVKQPFLLHVWLPECIVLRETFIMKTTVVNYLSGGSLIKVSVASNPNITVKPLFDDAPFCLCGKKFKTLKWEVTPKVLGLLNVTVTARILPTLVPCCPGDQEKTIVPPQNTDKVVETKFFTVKAGGTKITKTHNWLLCPKEQVLTKNINVQIPSNGISSSFYARVSVSGDFFARSLGRLGRLIQVKYKSGEQNIALMAMDATTLHYLKDTHQLTPEIQEKGVKALTIGYQAQLTYKHKAGGFSFYVSEAPSAWLTALVINTFKKAQTFVYIDPKIFEESKVWLSCQQQEDGCFKASGSLFSNLLKEDVTDELVETAFIVAALLDMDISTEDPLVKKGLFCLKKFTKDLKSESITAAMLAYVFKKAGLNELSSNLTACFTSRQHSDTKMSSLSVGSASYLVLTKLCGSISGEERNKTLKIIEWLVEKNIYSGQISLQETVLAYKCLALYFTRVPGPSGSSRVMLWSQSSRPTFYVNQHSRLVNQQMTLQEGNYNLKVDGPACAAVEVLFHYNVPTTTKLHCILSVGVNTVFIATKVPGQKVTLKIKPEYKGTKGCSNAVVLEVQVASGYKPLEKSLRSLRHTQYVDHVDYRDGLVVLTLRELCKGRVVVLQLKLVREHEVLHLQPSHIKMYDVQHPGDSAESEYTLGTVEHPKVQLPNIQLPNFHLPKVEHPKVSPPKVPPPKVPPPKVPPPKVPPPKVPPPKVPPPKVPPPKVPHPKVPSVTKKVEAFKQKILNIFRRKHHSFWPSLHH